MVVGDFLNYYSFTANYGRLARLLIFILNRSCCRLLVAKFKLPSMKAAYIKFSRDLTSPDGIKFAKLPYTVSEDLKIKGDTKIRSLYDMKNIKYFL
jgi:hypothetical protein